MYFKEHLPILRRDDLCNLPECLVTEIRMGEKKWVVANRATQDTFFYVTIFYIFET